MTSSATASPGLSFDLLGPLQVCVDGGPRALGGPKHRAILAFLLINRNRVVSMDSLASAVWEDDPPPAIVSSVHVAISALRRALSRPGHEPVLETYPPGYRLSVSDDAYDLARFSRHRVDGIRHFEAGQYDSAAADLSTALDVWRGPVLSDLSRFQFVADFAAAVEEERLVVLQLRIDVELRAGRAEAVLSELTELTAQYPLREHFWGQLATALYRLDRQADALACLRRLRDVLDQELGINPSQAIQDLELQILRQEQTLRPPVPREPPQLGATVDARASFAVAELVSSWGAVFPVLTTGVRIGRTPESDVVIADDRVSRDHATIRVDQGGLVLMDLKSRNGTYLNGRRLEHAAPLQDGDMIGIGRVSLTLRTRASLAWSGAHPGAG